jgi:hypothetical protein
MDYGIKVSKEGFDVKTAEDKNLSLKSGINIFKVSDDGSGSIDASDSLTVAHGLGIIPYFLVFMEDSDGKMRIANGSGNVASEPFRAYVDSTNLSITNNAGSAKKYYYYIHYDPQPT